MRRSLAHYISLLQRFAATPRFVSHIAGERLQFASMYEGYSRRSARLSNDRKEVPASSTTRNVRTSFAKRKSHVSSDRDDAPATVRSAKRKGKAASIGTSSKQVANGDSTAMLPPATPPPNKRRRKNDGTMSPRQPPPFTPTPSLVGIIAAGQAPAQSQPGSRRKKTSRPADPHATNALLRTPTGSRLVAYPDAQAPFAEPSSALKAAVSEVVSTLKDVVTLNFPKSTTDTLLKDACAHLCKVDDQGKLKKVIQQHPCKMFTPEGLQEEINPFGSLGSSIISQQVSGAAAASIKKKFIGLFDNPAPIDELPKTYFPKPADVAAKSIEELRSAGLSQRKAEYIQGLAEKFRDGELSAEMLVTASDEEIMEKLVAVRGLGKWSVEMFACFALKRMDVFSTGDLGVQRGMAAYMGRDVAKLKNKGGKWKYMSEQEMLDISEKFKPYRTLFQWYMWYIEDVQIGAISGD